MSGSQSDRNQQNKAPAKGKGRGGGQKRAKKRGKKKTNKSAIDPKRPVWDNPDGEAELRKIVGQVRPAHHPTAVVRSLGDPPLGKFASNAQHYYDAVYEKAQQFAVAVAAANGLLVMEESGESGDSDTGDDAEALTS